MARDRNYPTARLEGENGERISARISLLDDRLGAEFAARRKRKLNLSGIGKAMERRSRPSVDSGWQLMAGSQERSLANSKTDLPATPQRSLRYHG